MTKNKKIKNNSNKDRHFGVILEDINSKFKQVLEGNAALDAKMDKKFADVDESFEEVNYKLDIHGKILQEHGKMLQEHSKQIAAIQKDIEIIKMDTAFIKAGLKQKVDSEEFSALEHRVAVLERRLK